ncbi:unnamed protein product [Meloidogyne enterolobii]|uniref:Uncharacterized protein n=1 Tax=Meloidogyne enterolobii TaxID=390850 RepID=A0ACB1ASI1_MELEN
MKEFLLALLVAFIMAMIESAIAGETGGPDHGIKRGYGNWRVPPRPNN